MRVTICPWIRKVGCKFICKLYSRNHVSKHRNSFNKQGRACTVLSNGVQVSSPYIHMFLFPIISEKTMIPSTMAVSKEPSVFKNGTTRSKKKEYKYRTSHVAYIRWSSCVIQTSPVFQAHNVFPYTLEKASLFCPKISSSSPTTLIPSAFDRFRMEISQRAPALSCLERVAAIL